ncbi:MAG: FmdB family zinc ribbon protein [Halanaerobiaceae bacterium]
MPTYLYRCENCGKFEQFQKITADPLTECPECGGEVEKIIGNPGVIFKGSGFYCTNNRSESSGEESGEKTGEKAS